MDSPFTTRIPQLILARHENGTFTAEIPGLNGARHKVQIPEDEIGQTLFMLLADQQERINTAKRHETEVTNKAARERSERIFAITLRRHGKELAERVVPSMKEKHERISRPKISEVATIVDFDSVE